MSENIEHIIGQLNESSLHNQIKNLLAEDGDLIEQKIGRYFIDIVKPDRLVEIQTGSFSHIKGKLRKLLKDHKITIVYPIARVKYIVYLDEDSGEEISRRKSPKRGRIFDIFEELMRIPDFLADPNLNIHAIMIELDEFRISDGKGSWRRGGVSIVNRRLVDILDTLVFERPSDLVDLIPGIRGNTFTARNLAEKCNISIYTARKVCYTLRKLGAIDKVSKIGNAYVYEVG